MAAWLAKRTPVSLSDPEASRAAVAVILTQETDSALLVVKRGVRAGDPWSGHAALPGGFQSKTDRSAAETAERETEEETGLPLAKVGQRIGELDDVYPRAVQLPRVIVTPVVYLVPGRLHVSATSEIESALWVRLGDIVDPSNRKPFVLELDSGSRQFDSIHAGGLVIWGLTERVLQQLLTAIQ